MSIDIRSSLILAALIPLVVLGEALVKRIHGQGEASKVITASEDFRAEG